MTEPEDTRGAEFSDDVKQQFARGVARCLIDDVRPLLKRKRQTWEDLTLEPEQLDFIVWARLMGYITRAELRKILVRYLDGDEIEKCPTDIKRCASGDGLDRH